MTKLDILKATVPELVTAMKTARKAVDQADYFVRSRDLVWLIVKMNATYPKEITEASYLVAAVRFNRWLKDYEKVLQIKEALALESEQ